jgi:putative transcriptional regulator
MLSAPYCILSYVFYSVKASKRCLDDRKSCQKLLTRKVVNDKMVLTRKVVKMILAKEEKNVPLLNELKEYRSRLGINQTELGKRAEVSRQTISLIERGDYSPSVTLALKLAKICQVTVEDIFVYEEDEENEERKDK